LLCGTFFLEFLHLVSAVLLCFLLESYLLLKGGASMLVLKSVLEAVPFVTPVAVGDRVFFAGGRCVALCSGG